MNIEGRRKPLPFQLATTSEDTITSQEQQPSAPPPSPAGSSIRRHSAATSVISDGSFSHDLPSSAATSVTASSLALPFPTSPSAGPWDPASSSTFGATTSGDSWPSVSLNPPASICFNKNNQAFKLAYLRVKVSHTPSGELRQIELSGSDPDGFVDSSFIHTFPGSRLPVPHMEGPITSASNPPFVVSFLENQMINASGVIFNAQPHYVFNNWEDCVKFQETILRQQLAFTAGMARAKSKGRGEESISQNLRVWQTSSGRQTLFFFANSQRKGSKRYLFVPRDGIDSVEQKKGTVSLRLNANASELMATLGTLQLEFLDPLDSIMLCDVLDLEKNGKGNSKGKGKGKGKT